MRFPDGFLWGAATSSYQIEGAVREDGRSPSIWDTFSRTPGAVAGGDTGDVAVDHYHRYRDDLRATGDLGLGAYRFSVAWPRLQPGGRGPLDRRALDFYAGVLDTLADQGVEPWITLYHWDLPQSVQDAGGWPARDTAARFADFATRVHAAFGDRVAHWITLNEPWCSSLLGHAAGTHAPGVQDPVAAVRAAHHLLLAHGLAVEAMRAQDGGRSRFGITLNLSPVDAAGEAPGDRDAARRIDGLANRLFLDPVLLGRYPDDVLGDLEPLAALPPAEDGDLERIGAPLDFLGINYYMRQVVRSAHQPTTAPAPSPWIGCSDVEFVGRGLPRTAMGWEIDAEGLHDVLVRVSRDYDTPALYVTESGAAFPDVPAPDGSVDDPDRIAYLEAHFRAAHRAIGAGAALRGYFVWSLLDNFEWEWGYDKRFGLIHVDYATQRRTPKASARWYAAVTRANALAAEPDEARRAA